VKEDPWDQVEKALAAGDDETAGNLADELIATYPENKEVTRRASYVFYLIEWDEKALSLLEKLRESGESRQYADYADFHIALISLRTGGIADGRTTLKEIATNPDHRFADEAAWVDSRLSSIWHRLALK
jgi:hypothetical protein